MFCLDGCGGTRTKGTYAFISQTPLWGYSDLYQWNCWCRFEQAGVRLLDQEVGWDIAYLLEVGPTLLPVPGPPTGMPPPIFPTLHPPPPLSPISRTGWTCLALQHFARMTWGLDSVSVGQRTSSYQPSQLLRWHEQVLRHICNIWKAVLLLYSADCSAPPHTHPLYPRYRNSQTHFINVFLSTV